MQERLQKIIARAGIASRRHAEELIQSGFVSVNGRIVTELGSKADESTDHIKVSGKLLRPEHDRVHIVLNKPPEVVSTMSDPEGRRSLQDLLHGVSLRVFPVGRLEYHSTGLVFLTNDGDLANRMLKAHHLKQSYLLKLKTLLTFEEIEQLTRSTGARMSRLRGKESPWYEVTLSEARRDALRNKLFQTGHPVEKIKRIRLANLELGSLQPGEHRTLSSEDVAMLSRAIEGRIAPEADAAPKRKPLIGQNRSKSARSGNIYRPARTKSKHSHGASSKQGDRPKRFDRSSGKTSGRSGMRDDSRRDSRRDSKPGQRDSSARRDQPKPTKHAWPVPRKSR
ncbi:MAG: pseudouridine synthase [Candidatus Acidiferrales bacterium]